MRMHSMQQRVGRKQKKKDTQKRICLPRVYISGIKKATQAALNLFFSFSVASAVGQRVIDYANEQRGYFAIGSEYLLIAIVFLGLFFSVRNLLQEDEMKEEVEKMTGLKISDEKYRKAVKIARKKQERIYNSTGDKKVMTNAYLKHLIYEAVRTGIFEQVSSDICGLINDMKKEHLAQSKGTH